MQVTGSFLGSGINYLMRWGLGMLKEPGGDQTQDRRTELCGLEQGLNQSGLSFFSPKCTLRDMLDNTGITKTM